MTSTTITAEACASRFLQDAVASNPESEFTTSDLLRAFQQQAELLYETENVREQLQGDPFEKWADNVTLKAKIDKLAKCFKVIEVDRINTLSGYARIQAVVEIPMLSLSSSSATGGSKHSKKSGAKSSRTKQQTSSGGGSDLEKKLQLHFLYEREPEHTKPAALNIDPGTDSPTAWYSIDATFGVGSPKERLLWVQVWADGNTPHPGVKAENLEEDEDGWEDVDSDDDDDEDDGKRAKYEAKVIEDDENDGDQGDEDHDDDHDMEEEEQDEAQHETQKGSKRPRREGTNSGDDDKSREKMGSDKSKSLTRENGDHENKPARGDRFIAVLDPEVLHQFMEWLGIASNASQEATAFFLLMTFPFYEQEWDLVGFTLDSVFGFGDDENSDQDEKE